MATLSRAVAKPSSYVVSPVEAISTGRCSLDLGAATRQPVARSRLIIVVTNGRIADAEGTEEDGSCKVKTPRIAIITASTRKRKIYLSFTAKPRPANCWLRPQSNTNTSPAGAFATVGGVRKPDWATCSKGGNCRVRAANAPLMTCQRPLAPTLSPRAGLGA